LWFAQLKKEIINVKLSIAQHSTIDETRALMIVKHSMQELEFIQEIKWKRQTRLNG
jgi:hypothetical protein